MGHHDHAVAGHLHIQLDAVAALEDGRPEGGKGVFRGHGAVAPVEGDQWGHAAHGGEQGIVLGQGIEVDCRQPGGQRDPGHRSGEQGPAAKAVRFALRQLFRRAVTAAIVEECDDGALGRGDLAIQQKAEEGDLQQIQRTGEQQHGAGAPQSDQRRHTVNQQESSEKDQNRPDQRTEVPPQQHTGQPGQLCFDMGCALLNGFPQAFAFQRKEGEHQNPEQGEQERRTQNEKKKHQIERLCPDKPKDVLRHGQLRDIVVGHEYICKGYEQGAVKQDGPVLGEQDVADIPQRPDEQGNRTQCFAPAGQRKPVQEDGKAVQVPARRQKDDEHDPA